MNKTIETVMDSDSDWRRQFPCIWRYCLQLISFYCDFSVLKTNQTQVRQAVQAASKVSFLLSSWLQPAGMALPENCLRIGILEHTKSQIFKIYGLPLLDF